MAQAKYGDLCPNDGCKRREKTQPKMDQHLKSCRHDGGFKTTKTNVVKTQTLQVNVRRLKEDKFDFLPIIPMTISKGPEPNEEKEELVKTMFVDSGSEKLLFSTKYAAHLSRDHGFTLVKGPPFLVKGVDTSRQGVKCEKYLSLYFQMPGEAVEMKGLIVKGLPEEVIIGRETMRSLELVVSNGNEPEENFISSKKYGLHHLLPSREEEKKRSSEEADAYITEMTSDQSETRQTPSMFLNLTNEDLKEVFGEDRRSTEEQ